MPIYEYQCPKCGRFEQIQKFSDPPLKNCPKCEANGKTERVERLLSTSAFHLKGGGWYKTDYAAGSSAGGSSAGGSKPGSAKPAKTDGETAAPAEKKESPKSEPSSGE